MGELDVVQEHWNGFELYRSIIIANTIVSLPLTALTVYLIIYKSSQHIKTYKYALLNILFCVFATDLLLEIVVLPAPVFDISAVYSTGLASLMGSKASFVCEVIAIASVAEYLAALLFAFFYRYLALKNDVYLCGKPIERRHYWFGIIAVMITAPTSIAIALGMTYTPEEEFKEFVSKNHPEYLPFLKKLPIFQFSKMALITTSCIFFGWASIWRLLVIWCLRGIVNHFRVQKSSMHSNTYRLHIQLIKALVVQTAAPIVLCTIPILLVAGSLIFGLDMIDDVVKIADLTMSLHSTVNSLAMILLIAPYRNAIIRIFRKVSGKRAQLLKRSPSVSQTAALNNLTSGKRMANVQMCLYFGVGGRSMAEVDIVQRYRHSFELYRWIIIANTVTALPLNALTVYLIIHKSPTHIKTYKYLLLNIMLCVFITDIMLEVVVLPAPVLHVFGIYPTGLVHVFGTKLGFVCEVIAIASVSEYLAALLFAFFYRYLALKDDLFICGKLIERQHYRAAMIVVMIIAPSTIAVALGMSYVPDDEFKEYVRESHPELLPFFDKEPFFQLSKRALSLTCGIFLCWTIIWTALVAWCVSGIVRQFRLQKSIMHINTYRLHVQLLKSLVVQTAAPIVLCAIPIVLVTCSVLLELNILDEVVKIADLTMSLHSTVNSLAVIVLIAPYRNAALNAFRKMSGRNVLTVSVIPGPHSV